MEKTVLLVDDSKTVLRILERELSKNLSIKVLKAENFAQAKELVETTDIIHVAILDLNLPDAPNGEVVDYALEHNIPSVILTGTLNQSLKETIIKKDVIDYIVKNSPSSIKSVINVIDRTLKNYDTHVLVVGDDATNATTAEQLLKKSKLNVEHCFSLSEALELLESNKDLYSLVLLNNLDSMNSDMDMAFAIREKFKKDQLGIIVLSNTNHIEENINFIKLGANDFIKKPFNDSDFRTRVNSTLEIIELFNQNRQKEQQIFEQDKKLQISELLGNIAHQWRQPLNAVSVVVSGIKVENSLGILDESELDTNMDTILKKIQFLSQTINIFTSLMTENKNKERIVLSENLAKAIDIVKDQIHDSNIAIELIDELDNDLRYDLVDGELSQIMLSLCENSKSAIEQNNSSNPFIKIYATQLQDKIKITVEDNGGGISSDIMTKIFDPYFTTHHQSQGKGLGLYLCQKIVSESLNGSIRASNAENGAKITIEIPLQ